MADDEHGERAQEPRRGLAGTERPLGWVEGIAAIREAKYGEMIIRLAQANPKCLGCRVYISGFQP